MKTKNERAADIIAKLFAHIYSSLINYDIEIDSESLNILEDVLKAVETKDLKLARKVYCAMVAKLNHKII